VKKTATGLMICWMLVSAPPLWAQETLVGVGEKPTGFVLRKYSYKTKPAYAARLVTDGKIVRQFAIPEEIYASLLSDVKAWENEYTRFAQTEPNCAHPILISHTRAQFSIKTWCAKDIGLGASRKLSQINLKMRDLASLGTPIRK